MAKEKQTCETSLGSRLRKDVAKVFDCFLMVCRQVGEEPTTEFIFPADFSDQEIIQQSLLFCFPFENKNVRQARTCHFTFIFTDIEGKHRFGFCKLVDGGKKCFCILSFVPWFEIFYKLLNYASELSSEVDMKNLTAMLETLYNQDVPSSTESIQLNPTLLFQVPDPNDLPSIPENRNISEYFSALNPHCMIEIFASLMFERRVIFTSKNLSTLTSCVHSAEALLRPLHWQHIFIPVMPPHLLDYCLAPMPYLVGIHSSLMPRVRDMISTDPDVVIADVDEEEVESNHRDVESIPNDVISFLKSLLRKQNVQIGTNLALAFLRTQARLIGGFKRGLTYHQGELKIMFDEEKFVESYRSTTAKEFAKTLIQLQSFKQFIDGRLDMLNSGEGFKDSFENEVSVLNTLNDNEQETYKEWISMAKKGGNELFTQFKKKAKGNMKFARNEITQILKQQQQDNPHQNIKTLEENPQRIRPSRPERPPPISTEKLQEMRERKSRPPRPPPPRTRPSLKKSQKPRTTRKYNTLDLPDNDVEIVEIDGNNPDITNERDRSFSHFSNVDVNLMSEMESAFQDIVNTNSSNAKHLERQSAVDLLTDFNQDETEIVSTATEDVEKEKRPSEIFDEPLSPTFLAGTPSTPLVDLSISSTVEKQASMIHSDSLETSNDLLGLDIFPTSSASSTFAPITSDEKKVSPSTNKNWVTFESEDSPQEEAIARQSTNDIFNSFVTDSAKTLQPEKLYQTTPKKPDRVRSLPVQRATSQQVFSLTNPFMQQESVSRLSRPLSVHHTASSGKLLESQYAPYRHKNPGASTNVGTFNTRAKPTDRLTRVGTLPANNQHKLNPANNDLFADLLSNWKSKEGM